MKQPHNALSRANSTLDYLVLDDKPISPLRRAVSMEQVNGHVTPTGNNDMTRSLDLGNGELPGIVSNLFEIILPKVI